MKPFNDSPEYKRLKEILEREPEPMFKPLPLWLELTLNAIPVLLMGTLLWVALT